MTMETPKWEWVKTWKKTNLFGRFTSYESYEYPIEYLGNHGKIHHCESWEYQEYPIESPHRMPRNI